MKTFFYWLCFLSLISCSELKPEGEVAHHTIQIEAFEKLNLNGSFKVFFVKSTKNEIEVETQPNIFENLTIESKNNRLLIKEKKTPYNTDFYTITIHSTKNPSEIKLQKSVELIVSGQLSTHKLELKMAEKSKITSSILANKMVVELQDNAKAELQGNVIDAKISVTDSANFLSPNLSVNHLKINMRKSGMAKLWVEKQLEGKLTDKSQLIYYGMPNKKITQKNQAILKQETK